MNVLHFINNLNREGAQVMVSNLVSAAGNDRINHSICVPTAWLLPWAAELREKGVQVYEPTQYFGFWSMFQSRSFLKQVCQENQIRIIHAHMADAAFLGWLTARELNLPLVISHHGHDILLKCNLACRFVYYILLNLAARYAAMNIAVSPSVAERVSKLLRVNHKLLKVISNGVRIPEDSQLERLRSRQRNHGNKPRIVTVGRLVPLKGQHQLIYALPRLLDYFPGIRLIIVGGGDMAQELKQLAKETHVDSHIEFTGAVVDVIPYLADADIYVSCSQSEGMPVAVLEAMAWQLPIVASDIPGHRSVVKPGLTGYLYELDNTDELVRKVVSVVNNAELSGEVALRARTMTKQQYSVCVAAEEHAKMYLNIIR